MVISATLFVTLYASNVYPWLINGEHTQLVPLVKLHSLVMLAFLSNFKLGLKWLAVTNDPAANAAVLITTANGFIVLARCYENYISLIFT
jgi:hypothetical protein